MPTPSRRPPPVSALDVALHRVGDRWSLLLVEALLAGPAPLRRAARRPRRAGAQHPVEPAQGAGGRGAPRRPALLRSGPAGSPTCSRPAGPSWPARCACSPSGARSRSATDAGRRRCTTRPAAPPSRRAGGVPPAPASSTTRRTPSSTGCELRGLRRQRDRCGEDADLAPALVVVEATVGRFDELVAASSRRRGRGPRRSSRAPRRARAGPSRGWS